MHRTVFGAVSGLLVAACAFATALAVSGPARSAPSCPKPPKLPGEFVGQVTNSYFPLQPGTTLTYKGKLDGRSATDVFTVTSQTKEILGVTTTVAPQPMVGQVYKQEDAKNVAEDCSGIVDLNASVRTPFVSSNEALKTEEYSLLEPDVLDKSTT